MVNTVDPDQMPHSVASVLGLHCFFSVFFFKASLSQYFGLLQYLISYLMICQPLLVILCLPEKGEKEQMH